MPLQIKAELRTWIWDWEKPYIAPQIAITTQDPLLIACASHRCEWLGV